MTGSAPTVLASQVDYGTVIAAVVSTAEEYARALRALESFATADGIKPYLMIETVASSALGSAMGIARNIRHQVAMARRPKGPPVRVVAGAEIEIEELIRVTATQVITLDSRGECRYSLTDGRDVRRGQSGRIHADDLLIVQAMKPGPNAVSKALDEIKKASKS